MKKLNYFLVPAILMICFCSKSKTHYENGFKLLKDGYPKLAIAELKYVTEKSKEYEKAKILIDRSDSLLNVIERNAFLKDSTSKIANAFAEKEKVIADLQQKLKEIKSFNDAEYLAGGEPTSLMIEIALFTFWAKAATNAQISDDKTIRSLGSEIQPELMSLQRKAFPRIREAYAFAIKAKLWKEDIKVSYFGNGKTTIQFVGSIFASNKNKDEVQNSIRQNLIDFRFKKVNYKWYEYDDEYTIYTLRSLSDDDFLLY